MHEELKTEILAIINSINDKEVLAAIKELVKYYKEEKDIIDDMNSEQLKGLDDAIKKADEGKRINWEGFKTEIKDWQTGNRTN